MNRNDSSSSIIANRADIYSRENNAGNGFPVGDGNNNVNECQYATPTSGTMELLHASESDDDVAVYLQEQACRYVLVGDAHGPWAVSIDDALVFDIVEAVNADR